MTRAKRTRLKWVVSGGSAAWLLVIGWLMMATLPEGAVENHASDQVKGRMSECTGAFRDRYQCKEQIIIESGRETFYTLGGRFLLVILPPLFATFWLSSYLGRHPVLYEEEHHHVNDGDWKSRAQMHTQMQSPEEAAQELHLDTGELRPRHHPAATAGKGRHLIDDIAPVDDWKSRAQANIRGTKHD
jgi:hypothetical protein